MQPDHESKGGHSDAFLVICTSLLTGAVLPVIYYVQRSRGASEVFWALREHTRPHAFAVGGLIIGLAFGFLIERFHRRRERLDVQGQERRGWFVPLALGIGSLFVFSRWPNHWLLGDSYIWLDVVNQPHIVSSETLGRYAHYAAYQGLSLFGDPSRVLAMQIPSYLAGGFFVGAVAWLAPSAYPKMRPWVSCASLFFAPFVIFFYGYTETTPWAYAFVATYLLAGLRYFHLGLRRPPLA